MTHLVPPASGVACTGAVQSVSFGRFRGGRRSQTRWAGLFV